MTEGTTVLEWRGHTMVDKDGDNIGKIQEIYLDEQTEKPEWALVHTGLFGSKSSFVPLAAAIPSNGAICVPYEKGQVKDAPKIDADHALSQDEEATLYRHYGLAYGGGNNGVGHDTSGPNTDEAMTRSEEELAVGKAQRERGRVRLKKYVVTEEVQQTVPVQREEVRVEREPITEANVDQATDGPAISDEEHEVTLMEEQVVTEKRAVPKERVRLGKETVTDEQQVSDEVRKERIEVDGDGDGGSR
jgi:uncharacterized protein (TIGR02271 family)